MTLKELKEMEEVKSEKDFWKKHKIFNKTIGGITSNLKRFMSDPKGGMNHFEETLKEGVRIRIISQEFANKKKKEFYDKLNKPNKFKSKVKKYIKSKKGKIKKLGNKLRKKKNEEKDKKENSKRSKE